IVTARTAIEARVLVTERMQPLSLNGRTLHQVGVPYHWGSRGLTTGGSANDLFPIVLDPNVQIQEVKAASCDIRPGRRPRGKALRELVESYPTVEATAEPPPEASVREADQWKGGGERRLSAERTSGRGLGKPGGFPS